MSALKKNKPTAARTEKPKARQTKGDSNHWGVPFVLAVCVHAILFVGLFVVFQWNTESDDVVYAELWAPSQMSNVSQIAPETPKEPEEETEFLLRLKKLFNASCLMYNNRLQKREVRTIALCGGAGAFLIPQAIQAGADVFVTGEIKYHEFQGHANDILLASLGHFESEQYTVDLLESVIHNAFPQLLVRKTQINTNPIKYM